MNRRDVRIDVIPPRWNGDEYHTLPTRRRAQPLFMLAPFVWLWRLLERVYWQARGWLD